MNRIMVVMITGLWVAGALMADTVYLRNGKTLEGKVVRKGSRVFVEMTMGTVEISEDEIQHILIDEPASQEASSQSQPASAAASWMNTTGAGADFAMPETMVFHLMRRLAVPDPGTTSFELREQIRQWQGIVHDRKRRVGGAWIVPEEFTRRREAFMELSKEAQSLYREVMSAAGKDESKQRSARTVAFAKFRQAALAWQDPLLREFLAAVVDYQAGNFSQALTMFVHCREQAPMVAAFHQGEALCLIELNRGTEALQPAIALVTLRPDVPDAVDVLNKVIQAVPGQQIQTPLFIKAKSLSEQFKNVRKPTAASTNTTRWMLPGKDWMVREGTLPPPPMDRLIIRQGMSVPVGHRTLAIDRAVIDGALDILVCMEGSSFLFAKELPITGLSDAGKTTELAMVQPSDRDFGPLEIAAEAVPEGGVPVTLNGLGILAEMNSPLRRIDGRIKGQDSRLEVSARLAPGEAGSFLLGQDGRIWGFVSGATKATADRGGGNDVIPPKRIKELIDKARSSAVSRKTGRPADTQPAQGKGFVVQAVVGEMFGN